MLNELWPLLFSILASTIFSLYSIIWGFFLGISQSGRWYDFPGSSDSKASAYNVGDLHCTGLHTTHSSILAWKIPWMEEPGRLQFMGSQRVGRDWATSLLHFTSFLCCGHRALYGHSLPSLTKAWGGDRRGMNWGWGKRKFPFQPTHKKTQRKLWVVQRLTQPWSGLLGLYPTLRVCVRAKSL